MPYCLGRALAVALLACSMTAVHAQQDQNVRINQIQVIGTHNSYHVGLAAGDAHMWEVTRPALFHALDYRHQSITHQLNGGVRQIEIDIYADTKGGRYANPAAPRMLAALGLPPDPDFDPQHIMMKPGFKVMHVQDLDYRSNCEPLTACLAEVRAWSHAHPKHVPLFILIETKQHSLKLDFPTVEPETFTPEVFDALDREITSVFPLDEIITPDQVRGEHTTLEEAVRANGWPTLAQAQGKVVFLMDQKPVGPVYTAGHPSLRGRILFTNADPGQPDAAFMEQNEGSPEAIKALVQQGYLVRTFAAIGRQQIADNDTTRFHALLASGAQLISTDHPASEPAPSGYAIALPDNLAARCNVVAKADGCSNTLLEPPVTETSQLH